MRARKSAPAPAAGAALGTRRRADPAGAYREREGGVTKPKGRGKVKKKKLDGLKATQRMLRGERGGRAEARRGQGGPAGAR